MTIDLTKKYLIHSYGYPGGERSPTDYYFEYPKIKRYEYGVDIGLYLHLNEIRPYRNNLSALQRQYNFQYPETARQYMECYKRIEKCLIREKLIEP